jgi:hypothetical protein
MLNDYWGYRHAAEAGTSGKISTRLDSLFLKQCLMIYCLT